MSSNRKIRLVELDPPFVPKKEKQDGVLMYDIDNAYPSRMEMLIKSSITAKSSAGMLQRFLTGQGFVNEKLNNLVIGKDRYGRNLTLYYLLSQVAKSVSYYSGFYIRVGYSGEIEKDGFKMVVDRLRLEKFKHCRFAAMDDNDTAGKIIIYNNWDRLAGRVNKKDWKVIDIYNDNKDAIKAQIQGSDGINKWLGQVFFWFADDEYIYPESPVDPVNYDADTESQISIFKNGEVRRGFFLKNIIHHSQFDNESDAEEFTLALKDMTGAGHNVSNIVLEGNFDNDGKLIDGQNVKVEKIEQNINDKLFDTYEGSTTNNIRKAFNAIPQILVDYEDSALGTTSGEALTQAAMFYNKQTQDIRKNISQCFMEIMKNWHCGS